MGKQSIQETDTLIWFNHSIATPPSPAVLEHWTRYANPFSQNKTLDVYTHELHKQLSKLIPGCDKFNFRLAPSPHLIPRMILNGLLQYPQHFQGKNQVLVPTTASQYAIQAFCSDTTYHSYDWLIVDTIGNITEETLIESITPKTLLLSLSVANGMLGSIQPLDFITSICKQRQILLHIDITDCLGKYPLPQEVQEADILSFSSASLGSLDNLGGIFFKDHLKQYLDLWFSHSNSQGYNISSSSITSLNVVLEEVIAKQTSFSLLAHTKKTFFTSHIKQQIPEVEILFPELSPSLSNIAIIAFPRVSAESLLLGLQQSKIYASIGLNRFLPLSQILQGCGISPSLCHSSLHFSFSSSSSNEEILFSINTLSKLYNDLLKLTSITL